MRIFSSNFIAEKNKLEGAGVWTHLVEITVGVSSIGRFVSHPETVTWNSNIYMPVPMRISAEEQSADGSLPQITIDVSNPAGAVYQMAKQNDLALKQVILRMVNLNLTNSGDDARIKLKILGTTFAEEVARFSLGFGFNFDAEGPKRIYNRRDHDCVPVNHRNYAVIGG